MRPESRAAAAALLSVLSSEGLIEKTHKARAFGMSEQLVRGLILLDVTAVEEDNERRAFRSSE